MFGETAHAVDTFTVNERLAPFGETAHAVDTLAVGTGSTSGLLDYATGSQNDGHNLVITIPTTHGPSLGDLIVVTVGCVGSMGYQLSCPNVSTWTVSNPPDVASGYTTASMIAVGLVDGTGGGTDWDITILGADDGTSTMTGAVSHWSGLTATTDGVATCYAQVPVGAANFSDGGPDSISSFGSTFTVGTAAALLFPATGGTASVLTSANPTVPATFTFTGTDGTGDLTGVGGWSVPTSATIQQGAVVTLLTDRPTNTGLPELSPTTAYDTIFIVTACDGVLGGGPTMDGWTLLPGGVSSYQAGYCTQNPGPTPIGPTGGWTQPVGSNSATVAVALLS